MAGGVTDFTVVALQADPGDASSPRVRPVRGGAMSCAPRRSLLAVLGIAVLAYALALPLGALTVTSLADSGPGTLREAIGIANSDGIPTTIDFAAGLAGGVISPLSQLPDLTENGTTIDGDLGANCVPDIALDGSAAGPGAV